MFEQLVNRYFDPSIPFIVSYTVGFLAAYSSIQSIKLARRECARRKYPNVLIRLLSFLFAGTFTFGAFTIFYHLEFERALFHSLISGMTYPIAMSFVMPILKRRYPDIYDRVRVRRRRNYDNSNQDPDDTGEFFF